MTTPFTGLFIDASCNTRSYGTVSSTGLHTHWNRIVGTISTFVMTINTFLLPTQQWLLALDDRPCAHNVQLTRRMSLTPTRLSTKGSPFQLVMSNWNEPTVLALKLYLSAYPDCAPYLPCSKGSPRLPLRDTPECTSAPVRWTRTDAQRSCSSC